MERKALAQLLRGRRIELELTVREIAERLGVSAMLVSYFERGEQVPQQDDRLVALADAYDLPLKQVRGAAFESHAARGTVELPTNERAERDDTALLLARTWRDLSDDQIRQLRKIAEGTNGAE